MMRLSTGMLILAVGLMGSGMATAQAADNQSSSGAQATTQSLGGQAGEVARELKDQADESLKTGRVKAAEVAQKVETDTQDAMKTFREQLDAFSKQFQTATQQLSQQMQKQWEDFQKSFNNPPK